MDKREKITTEDIALDIISNLNGYLCELKQKNTKKTKKKYLQYAPQVFQICVEFERFFN